MLSLNTSNIEANTKIVPKKQENDEVEKVMLESCKWK